MPGLADWVATGTITGVVHHQQGEPVFKDFADFTFTVKTSEKGTIKIGRTIRLQVGWCQNWLALPKDTAGTFRFYGLLWPPIPLFPTSICISSRSLNTAIE